MKQNTPPQYRSFLIQTFTYFGLLENQMQAYVFLGSRLTFYKGCTGV